MSTGEMFIWAAAMLFCAACGFIVGFNEGWDRGWKDAERIWKTYADDVVKIWKAEAMKAWSKE